jgi:hypothetical protein
MCTSRYPFQGNLPAKGRGSVNLTPDLESCSFRNAHYLQLCLPSSTHIHPTTRLNPPQLLTMYDSSSSLGRVLPTMKPPLPAFLYRQKRTPQAQSFHTLLDCLILQKYRVC